MIYEFPKITRIEQMLEAIEGKKEFIVADRGWFTVIQYVVNMEDTFPTITKQTNPKHLDQYRLLREGRGIVFDDRGDILSRALHKFFNLNERHETQERQIDFSKPHSILEKLDGSYIRPLWNRMDERFWLATKMGVTDVAKQAQEFIKDKPRYEEFFQHCHENGLSPAFEWCSDQNRIVISYPEDRLVLIAIRETVSGKYLQRHRMTAAAIAYNIPFVKEYGTEKEIKKFLSTVNDHTDIEGFIVRFDDGHMIKIKTDQYLIKHKSKDIAASKRRIIEHVLNETIDDIKPRLIPIDLERVEAVEKEVAEVVKMFVNRLQAVWDKYHKMDRKNFAMNIMPKIEGFEAKGFFSMKDGKTPMELVKPFLLQNVKTDTAMREFNAKYGVFDDDRQKIRIE